jgi:STE24 endopeptidase
MRIARPGLLAFGFAVALLFVAPRICPCQAALPGAASPPSLHHSAPPQSVQPGPAEPSRRQAYSLPPDKLAKAIALGRIRNILEFAGSLWGLAVLWLLLASRAAAGLAAWTERLARRRWIEGLLFFAILLVVLAVANLPLDLYAHHVSLSYGISVQGWGSWLGDQAKALGLSVLIGAPVMLLFHWIVRRWGRRYWLGAWAVAVPLMVLGAFASPLLEPVFNKFEPLAKSDPALVAQLEKVVARTGTQISPSRMFLMKASAKTNGLNAYVSGLGATRRVVVWDTTAGRIPNGEILFIFGHETGHYVLHHIPKILAGSAAGLFFVFWGCAGFAGWLARRFGARWQLGGQEDGAAALSSRAGFVVLLFTVSVASFLLEPVGNAFSRHFEHQADIYGQEAIHGIVADPQKTAVSAFNHLGEAWLEDPNPSPFIEFWTYSHPSVQQRANFALHYDPWANGGHGRFFDK